jgi:hypothetical protein
MPWNDWISMEMTSEKQWGKEKQRQKQRLKLMLRHWSWHWMGDDSEKAMMLDPRKRHQQDRNHL